MKLNRLLALGLSILFFVPTLLPGAALAVAKQAGPAGTMLIPLTPKIDTRTIPAGLESAAPDSSPGPAGSGPSGAGQAPAGLAPAPEKISPEVGNVEADVDDGGGEVGPNTTLKGMIQLTADDTEYDQEKNTFLGTGNAVVYIGGQDSKLEADTILYDQNNEIIDARGNVRIFRDGQVTTGSAFRFKVNSDEYLITRPDTELQGATIIARQGIGTRDGLAFRKGTMQLPSPVHIANGMAYGPMSTTEMIGDQLSHPIAYLPGKPSFRFKARKITFEKYREDHNLTIFGGKLMFGNFGIPLPKFTMSAGAAAQRVTFPVTPMLVNNLQMGGTSIGPSFNYSLGKDRVFNWAPLLQLGGRNPALGTSSTTSGKIGAGVRIGYVTGHTNFQAAYGSNSNLVVAQYKYFFNNNLKWQSGINRYLEDGLFGYRRARLLGELVSTKTFTRVPFMQSVTFRTAGGFAQDNPALLNQTPQLQQLFNTSSTNPNTHKFALRVQEQVMGTTQPLFAFGTDKVGVKSYFYGGAGLKGYSTGNAMGLLQGGPILDIRLDRVRLQTGYTQSAVRGSSPFVFDQFIQGNRSTSLQGDVRICKYLTLGGMLGYNLDAKGFYQKAISAAIGPDDFKFLVTRQMMTGYNRFGFNVMYGAPVPYDRLVLKGSPDAGQLGGI